jgi:alpha-galactosidase
MGILNRYPSLAWSVALAGTLAAATFVISATPDASRQDATTLQQAAAPPDGVWLDSLNLSQVALRPAARGRGGARGAAPQPPPPPVYVLGGVTYPHTVTLQSDRDFAIDLKGQAVRFASMVGIDDSVGAGRGSVIFGVWVDGRKVADSGLMKGGDAPKLLSADLAGAQRLVLAVIDGNDGTSGDSANWGGALITMKPGAADRPEVVAAPADAPPPIAASRSSAPLLNYPRITGATPGKPFMFLIPASGDEPLTFDVKNLPSGLTLNSKTGLITGALTAAGRTVVHVTVTNVKGTTSGDFTIVGGDDALALTPPLGWNSWNAWGNTVTQDRVRASADGLVKSGLHRQGYTYINIDDVWEARERDPNGDLPTNEKFPDMVGLVDHIHSLGLKAGLYSSPGPATCQGLPASYQHEERDARRWAKWGFDYLKYDWCSYSRIAPNPTIEDRKAPYKLMGDIVRKLDRDIVFSVCQYGAGNVWEWGNEVGGHLWRMTGDITDTWPSMTSIGFQQTGREQYAGPGGWNDTDMLVVGMVGWSAGSRPTRLTPNEQVTHITLWALQAAPMLIGADLSRLDEWTTNLLGNREVLGVNQDALGKPAGRKMSDGWVEVWARPLEDGTMAVGLFNRGPEPAPVTATWKDLGLTGSQPVRDLWRQVDLKKANNAFSTVVPRHGAVLVKIGQPRTNR